MEPGYAMRSSLVTRLPTNQRTDGGRHDATETVLKVTLRIFTGTAQNLRLEIQVQKLEEDWKLAFNHAPRAANQSCGTEWSVVRRYSAP